MSKEVKDEPKKRGHRKKKFGDQESRIIAFRVGTDTYKENKTEIRKKVNNVLVSFSSNGKENKPEHSKQEKPVNKDGKKDNKAVEETKENKEKIFKIDMEEYEQRDYIKEFTSQEELEQPEENRSNSTNLNKIVNIEKSDPKEVLSYFDRFKDPKKKTPAHEEFIKKSEPELTERDKLNLRDEYERYREAVDEEAQEYTTEINDHEERGNRTLEDIYEEFKDEIDQNSEVFKKFFDKKRDGSSS